MPTADDFIRMAERLDDRYSAYEEQAILLSWAAELAESRETLTHLALCELKCSRGAKALENAKRAVGIAPDNHESLNALGLALASQLDGKGARKAFDRAIQVDPAEYAPYFNRAAGAFQFGDYEDAAEDFVRGILLHGEILESRLRYTWMVLELQGADHLAKQVKKMKAESGSKHAQAFLILALVGKYLQNPGKFPKGSGRRLRLPGRFAWTVPVIRFIAERDWRTHQRNIRLCRYLDQAIKAKPDDSSLRWARAELLLHTNDKRRTEDIDWLAKKHPKADKIRSSKVRLLMKDEDSTRAMAENDRWLEDCPDDYEPLDNRATMLMRQEKYVEALECYDRLVELYAADDVPSKKESSDDDDEEEDDDEDYSVWDGLDTSMYLYLDRAECLAKLGRVEDAERDYGKAMQFHDARDFSSLDHRLFNVAQLDRARFYTEAGRLKDALADYDQCIADSSPIPLLHEERAEIRRKLGDEKGAEEDVRRSKEITEEADKKKKEAGGGN